MWEDEIKGAASNGRRGGGSRRRRVKKPWHEIFGERERERLPIEEGSEDIGPPLFLGRIWNGRNR